MSETFVDGVCVLVPRASLEAWPDGAVTPIEKPDLSLLERSLRRGLSDVTRMFMHVALGALRDAHALDTPPRVIFASAFGEIVTAEAMLAQALDENSASPVRFRQSVHNAAEGLYSISAQNCKPSTAIAAGWDTVAMGLIEAKAQLTAEAGPVLLVFVEEPVPKPLSDEHPHGPLAVAFALSPREGPRTRAILGAVQRKARDGLSDPYGAEHHPLGPALCVARAIERRRAETVIVGEGASPYCVSVAPSVRA